MKKVFSYTAISLGLAFSVILLMVNYFSEDITEKAVPSRPVLVQEGFHDFNIVQHADAFYGISQREGPIDVTNLAKQAKYPWVVADTLEKTRLKVKSLISSNQKQSPENSPAPALPIGPPKLIEESYKGYNIVWYNELFYGIAQREGPIDVRILQTKAKHKWFSGISKKKVKADIDVYFNSLPKPSVFSKIKNKLRSFIQ